MEFRVELLVASSARNMLDNHFVSRAIQIRAAKHRAWRAIFMSKVVG